MTYAMLQDVEEFNYIVIRYTKMLEGFLSSTLIASNDKY